VKKLALLGKGSISLRAEAWWSSPLIQHRTMQKASCLSSADIKHHNEFVSRELRRGGKSKETRKDGQSIPVRCNRQARQAAHAVFKLGGMGSL
jgi:hypothetical protein